MTKLTSEDAIRVETLRKAGFSYLRCAEQLGFSKSTIAKHCQRIDFLNSLPPVLKVYKGKIQGRTQLKIKQYIISNPKATLADIKSDCELDVSIKTLWTYLKRFGIPTQKAKFRIVVSDINKQKRVDFCRLMLAKDDAYIQSIIFSDETIVKSRPNGEIVFFRAPPGSEFFEPSNASGGKSVMFWGCISLNAYGPLVVIEGKNTADTYIETLNDYLLPELAEVEGQMVFQQDNAAIHKTPAVMTFMAENRIETFEWPPQSPDLSPIENVWNVMKMKMKALKPRPRSHAKMRDACFKIWRELDDGIRKHLVKTFKSRLEKCLAANGDIIKF